MGPDTLITDAQIGAQGGLAAADGRNIRTAMQSNDTPKNRRSAMKHPNSQRPCAPAAISMTGRANRARG